MELTTGNADAQANKEGLKSSLFERIREAERVYLGSEQHPQYGQFLLTGLIYGKPYDFDHALGYVVQIRKQEDSVMGCEHLIRHADGRLVVHKNQMFWLVPDEFITEVQQLFLPSPSDEGGDTVYSIDNGEPMAGFIVEMVNKSPDNLAFATTVRTDKKFDMV